LSILRRRKQPPQEKKPRVPSRLTEATRVFFRDRPWWETAILIVGAVAILTFLSVSFLGVTAKPRHVTVSADLGGVDSPVFLAAVARLVGASVEYGGRATVLDNGDAFLPALLEAIRGARTSVNFTVFMWEDGRMSAQVLDALIERQRHGVQVRILLDGWTSMGGSDDRFDALSQAGGRVATFRTPKFGSWMRVHRRNHRRAIVIDGEVGFTGGMAVDDKWLGNAQDPEHWRDVMFKLTGPMAASLQAAFADIWAGTTGEILGGPGIYRPAAPPSDAAPPFIHLVHSPADDTQSLAYFYLSALFAARERVDIATPYFIPDTPMLETLIARAKSGIRIRMLLPSAETDNPWGRWSGQNHYQVLMDAGVEIYEFQPTFMHGKFVVVDGRWSIIGSANLNSRSRQLDEENVFGILDRGLGAALERSFAADLQRAQRIDRDQWRRRNPLSRLLQLISRILDQQS
jgi:cardiolipin synthase A/B